MKKAEAYWPLILFLAIIKFLLPLFLQDPVYELQRDEYLYYQQGQHFALGYLENPPLLSWLGMISSWFGGSEAWIKLWPCLFGAATLAVACLIAVELGGNLFAQFLAGLGMMTGAWLRVHYLFQPNILDIFFWTLSLYFLVRYINMKEQRFIYWLAISLALGCWGKYSVLFLAIALVIALVLSPYRSVLTKKRTWLAAGLALLIILPNIWWQYSHNWPLLHHMKELQDTQLRYLNRIDFLKEQLLLLFPVLFVWLTGFVWLLRKPDYRVFGITYIGIIVLLMFGSGKGYYALGVYPLLLAAGGVAIEKWTVNKQWLRYVLSIFVLLLTLPFIPLLLPVWKPAKLSAFYEKMDVAKTGILKWEDQEDHSLPQDFADMLGWKELTEKTERVYQSLPDSARGHTIIYCRHYGQAGSLKFYGKNKAFKDAVITDNGSFLLWIPDSVSMRHLIFIGRNRPGLDDEVFLHFRNVIIVDSVSNKFSRQYGDKIILFANIDSEGLQLAREGLLEMKKQYKR